MEQVFEILCGGSHFWISKFYNFICNPFFPYYFENPNIKITYKHFTSQSCESKVSHKSKDQIRDGKLIPLEGGQNANKTFNWRGIYKIMNNLVFFMKLN